MGRRLHFGSYPVVFAFNDFFAYGKVRGSCAMIDENCVIWKKEKGLCWCPSSAWGLSDQKLCQLCQIKNAEIIEKIEIINPTLTKARAARQL